MAMSIQEIIFHSQNRKYPDIITIPGHIQNIIPTTTDDGTEIFQFVRPSLTEGIDQNTGNIISEFSAVAKSDLENYSQEHFGHSLPERIAPHGFSREDAGFLKQMDAPSGRIDPIYTTRPNNIHINHGWKIHADFVTDMTREQGLSAIGRADDYSIVDQKLANQFDERLSKLGINSEDFYKFYKTMGEKGLYANPNDVISVAETFDRNNMQYKMGISEYGQGRHITGYPQNIVDRDKIIKDLEDTMGTRLMDQNDAAYRRTLSGTGVKNHPLSRSVSGRFTTDYLDVNPKTGQVDFSLYNEAGAIPEEYKITGTITPEQIERINKVTAEMPEMSEFLHGPEGYISPYKTIEQIAEERSTGKIATSYIAGGIQPADDTYHGPLPSINKPGNTTTKSTISVPTDAEIKAAMGNPPSPSVEPDTPKNLTPQQQAFLDNIKAEKAADEAFAVESLGKTKQAVEESGYLYHYAPRDARDSIMSQGLMPSKARTAVGDVSGPLSELSTHVPDNSMYFFTNPNDAPSAGMIFGYEGGGELPDLYRVKVTQDMLEGMVVDPRLAIRDGVASAVIVPSKTESFAAELIGENARFGMPLRNADPELAISPATYDPIAKKVDTPTPAKSPEANITAAGRNRQMVPANYSKMSDDELLSNYQSAKELYEKQLVIDPDGKAFMPTARGAVEGYERELAKRGIDPNAVAPPKMEAKVTSENVSSKPAGEAVAPASDSVDKAKSGRKGPSSLGTPADVRTRPTPLGTTNASPQVTQNGTVKPPTSVPTPTTSNTTAATAVNNTQAKVTSQAVTQTDDAVEAVSKVKRVSTRGKTLLDNGMDTARKLASGNARAMGIAGAAALLGGGALAMRRKSEEDIETRLNRQRYGEMR